VLGPICCQGPAPCHQGTRDGRARRCPDEGLLHHPDQGSPYASEDYQKQLEASGIVCSMSRRGNCYDNAAMESWFSTFKSELGEQFESYAQAKERSFDYIEVFYNQRRIHSSLGYLAPAEFERRHRELMAARVAALRLDRNASPPGLSTAGPGGSTHGREDRRGRLASACSTMYTFRAAAPEKSHAVDHRSTEPDQARPLLCAVRAAVTVRRLRMAPAESCGSPMASNCGLGPDRTEH
jgi:hypothetical protein